MKLIISPAKKMNVREDELEPAALPCFLEQACALADYIKNLTLVEAQAIWKCNDSIARLNYERFLHMDLEKRLTPAILSYEGIQYQYMAPGVFQTGELDYVQSHLRILSGFYGILRPLDGIVPYRLEMQAKIDLARDGRRFTDLYAFWGDRIYRELVREDRTIVNLASKEYSKAVEAYLEPDVHFINVVFGCMETDKKGNPKIKVKGTEAKMARGEMVRFLAERGAGAPEAMLEFDRLGYRYRSELSDQDNYTFIKEETDNAGGRN